MSHHADKGKATATPKHAQDNAPQMPKSVSLRDNIDRKPRGGLIIAVIMLVAFLLAIVVPWLLYGNVLFANRTTSTPPTEATQGDISVSNKNANTDTNNATKADKTADKTSDNTIPAYVSDKDGVSAQNFIMQIPTYWDGKVKVIPNDDGSSLIVQATGQSDDDGLYLAKLIYADGESADVGGDIGHQVVTSVSSADAKHHVEVWGTNIPWLATQENSGYDEDESLWDELTDLSTGGIIKSRKEAKEYGEQNVAQIAPEYITGAFENAVTIKY